MVKPVPPDAKPKELANRELGHLRESLFEHYNDALFLMPFSDDGVHGNFIDVNQVACERLGYSRDELLQMNARTINPASNSERIRAFGHTIRREGKVIFEAIHVAKNGEQIPVEVTAKLIQLDAGEYVISIARDLREVKKIQKSEALFGRLMEHSWDEIYVFDSETLLILKANKGALANLGYSNDEINQLHFSDIHTSLNKEAFMAECRQLLDGSCSRLILEGENRRKDGSYYPVEIRLQLSHSEVPPILLANVQDITQRKAAEASLQHMANFDALTDLPNRSLFMEHLHREMALCRRNESLTALIFIDLDGFKFINDSHGHDMGDRLLIAVAQRLKQGLRTSDLVSRLGGDEFTIILSNIRSVQDVENVANKIIKNISQTYEIDNTLLSITPSLGICLFPFSDEENAFTLIKKADTAMYQAKALGKNCFQFYAAALAEHEYRENQLKGLSRDALINNELFIHYQPRFDLTSGKMVGAEALLRWRHPLLGNISPEEFIPILEQGTDICRYSRWLMEQCMSQLQSWVIIDPTFRLSINVSVRQFTHDDLITLTQDLLSRYPVSACNLELEITEGILISQTDEAKRVLHKLKEMGITIALDDFGSGYSSLNYLKQFPIDILKIDRSFVMDLGMNDDNTVITRSIIQLAHALHLRVTAEGVETEAQLAFLRQHKCNEAQGYLLSKPITREGLSSLLQQDKRLS